MQELDSINGHRLFRDGPLLIFENHGNFSLAEAERATAVYSQIIQEEGYLQLILDISDSHEVDGRTRKHLADWGKVHSAQATVAAVGGNLVFRTTFSLLINAIRLISEQPLRVHFCRDRSEARTWLAAQPTLPARPTPPR